MAIVALTATSPSGGAAAAASMPPIAFETDAARSVIAIFALPAPRSLAVERVQREHQAHLPAGWKEEVDYVRSLPEGRQISEANDYINRAKYVPESVDRLVSPAALLSSGGDCEDFAFAKRELLLEAGWDASQLRIIVHRATSTVWHAILVVRAFGTYLVLNNDRRPPHMLAEYFLPGAYPIVTDYYGELSPAPAKP